MKKPEFPFMVLVSLFILSLHPSYAQSEIVFRPGPGLNDGTDKGSATAGKDTVVAGSAPTRNYGSEPYMNGTPQSTCNPAMARAYLQFDLSDLPASVQQVFLGVTHFPHTASCFSNCNADFYFYPVGQPWNEMTLTYGTMPSETAAVHGPVNISFPNDFGKKEYDITAIYRNWKSGSVPNYGLAIHSPKVGCNNAAVMFYVHTSDDPDTTLRPYLRIVPSASAQRQFHFAQVADGGGFSTTFTIPNTSKSAVSGVLKFFNPNGTPRTLRVNGVSNSRFDITIPPEGSAQLKTDNVGPALAGWASLETDAAVQGIATFDLRDTAGKLMTTAAVFGSSAVRKVAVPVEVSAAGSAGIAVANVSASAPATVRLRLVTDAGLEAGTVLDPRLDPLGPQQQVADFAQNLFRSVPGINTFRGTLIVEVVGTGEIAVTGLVLKEGLLSALPVIDLTSLLTASSQQPDQN